MAVAVPAMVAATCAAVMRRRLGGFGMGWLFELVYLRVVRVVRVVVHGGILGMAASNLWGYCIVQNAFCGHFFAYR